MNRTMQQTRIWMGGNGSAGDYATMRDYHKTQDDLQGEFIVVVERNLEDAGGDMFTVFSDALCAAMSASMGDYGHEDIVILDMVSNCCWRITSNDENEGLYLAESRADDLSLSLF